MVGSLPGFNIHWDSEHGSIILNHVSIPAVGRRTRRERFGGVGLDEDLGNEGSVAVVHFLFELHLRPGDVPGLQQPERLGTPGVRPLGAENSPCVIV